MRVVAGLLAVACAVQASSLQNLKPEGTNGDWPSYGGTNWSQKYSPLDHITRQNFGALKVAWTWSSPDHDLIKKIPDNPEEPTPPSA